MVATQQVTLPEGRRAGTAERRKESPGVPKVRVEVKEGRTRITSEDDSVQVRGPAFCPRTSHFCYPVFDVLSATSGSREVRHSR